MDIKFKEARKLVGLEKKELSSQGRYSGYQFMKLKRKPFFLPRKIYCWILKKLIDIKN